MAENVCLFRFKCSFLVNVNVKYVGHCLQNLKVPVSEAGGQLAECQEMVANCILAGLPVKVQWRLVAILAWEAVANSLRLIWMRVRPNDPFPVDW